MIVRPKTLLLLALVCSPAAALAAAPGLDSTDPLASVDRSRNSLIADIVRAAQPEIAKASPGNVAEESAKLAQRLSKLRADRLLAASLISTSASLEAVLLESESLGDSATNNLKALGDPARDLLYTPLTPCRLIDTRGFGAPISGGAFAPNSRRAYSPNGLCGLPATGVASLMVALTTQNLTPSSGGYLAIVGPGAPVSTTADVFNLGSEWSATNTVVPTGTAAQFDVLVNTANAHVVVDILGYFGTSPAGAVGTTQIADGAVTAAKLNANGCTAGQVLQFNGTAWLCGAVSGPPGPTGAAGPPGPQGPAGPQGVPAPLTPLASASSSASQVLGAQCAHYANVTVSVNGTGPGKIVVNGTMAVTLNHVAGTSKTVEAAIIALGGGPGGCTGIERALIQVDANLASFTNTPYTLFTRSVVPVTTVRTYTFALDGGLISGYSPTVADTMTFGSIDAQFIPD